MAASIPAVSESGGVSSSTGFSAGAQLRDIIYFDDFLEGGYVADLALALESNPSAKFSEVADAGVWKVTRDAIPTLVISDQVGGCLLITTANGANDFVSCQLNGSAWKVASDKDLWFEIRFRITDDDDTQFFVGLCTTDVTGAAKGPILDSVGVGGSMIGFVQDGDTTSDIDIICQNNGTETQTDSTVNIVEDVFIIMAFHIKSNGVIEYFIDGVSVGEITTNIPDADAVTLSMEVHSPTASSTLEVDYIFCGQGR